MRLRVIAQLTVAGVIFTTIMGISCSQMDGCCFPISWYQSFIVTLRSMRAISRGTHGTHASDAGILPCEGCYSPCRACSKRRVKLRHLVMIAVTILVMSRERDVVKLSKAVNPNIFRVHSEPPAGGRIFYSSICNTLGPTL